MKQSTKIIIYTLIACCLYTCYSQSTFAQNMPKTIIIDTKIIDKNNSQPLPYASVYIGEGRGTISNQEGEFCIRTLENETLRISFVGYKTKLIKASDIHDTILLEPESIHLNEIVVQPLDINTFLRDALTKYKEEYKSSPKQSHSFFYRQITKTDDVCSEVIESFLNASPQFSLQKLEFVTGRYAAIQGDSLHKYPHFTNFYHYSQIGPVLLHWKSKIKSDQLIPPIFDDCKDYYTFTYDAIYNSETGATTYKINFKPLKKLKNPMMIGSIYIDASSKALKKLEGSIVNNIIISKDSITAKKRYDQESKADFIINFKENCLVESVIVNMKVNIYCKRMNIHSVMYNVGTKAIAKSRNLTQRNDLLGIIKSQKYRPEFWKEQMVIKRTPLEKSAVEIFERDNVFGTYALPSNH